MSFCIDDVYNKLEFYEKFNVYQQLDQHLGSSFTSFDKRQSL